MDEHSGQDHPQSRVKRRAQNMWRSALLTLVAILAVGLVAGYYLYLHKGQQPSFIGVLDDSAAGPAVKKEEPAPAATDDSAKQIDDTPAEKEIPPTVSSTEQATSPPAAEEDSPEKFIDEIEDFYAELDEQHYLQNFGIEEKSRPYLNKLLQKLADHPPVVLRETDNLYTLLKNTSHFFRLLGKNNIQIVRGIVDKDLPRLEKILKAYYDLHNNSDRLAEEFGFSLPPDSLTAYAGYFLNSMGGRLYLFRRTPGTRLLVTYYAILVIDQANKEENQPLGIDLRPPINTLTKEMEDGGRSLHFRQHYLETLYRLQERYN